MIAVNSFGKIVMSKRYLSPDGRFCSSRLDALRYMVKERMFSAGDLERMKAGTFGVQDLKGTELRILDMRKTNLYFTCCKMCEKFLLYRGKNAIWFLEKLRISR